jgi:nucleoside-diphosphate-sugar epimerase
VCVLHELELAPIEPVPLTEDSPLRTIAQTYPAEQIRMLQQLFGWLDDAYDKVAVERAVQSDPELAATVLRLPMVDGPGDPLHRLFPVLKRMLDGRPVIPFEERVARWRSPRGYAENVAAAIVLAATSDRAAGRVYNVGEAEAFSELEWAQLIAEAVGWGGRVVAVQRRAPAHLKRPGNLDQDWVADTSRIRTELSYTEPSAARFAARSLGSAHPLAQYSPGGVCPAEDAALATQ